MIWLTSILLILRNELGDIVYVEIEKLGDNLRNYEVSGTLETVKKASDLFLPLAGEIVEVTLELVNSDPYGEGEGCMIKIKVENLFDAEGLLRSGTYASFFYGKSGFLL